MGLFIPNMKMPKRCADCEHLWYSQLNQTGKCGLNDTLFDGYLSGRNPNCPLVEMSGIEERKRGSWGYRWKIHGDGRRPTELFPCSECGYENTSATNFCPNCGADMREIHLSEEEEED